MSTIAAVLLLLAGVAPAAGQEQPACSYDRAAMLALDEEAFDQGEGGWRTLEGKPECKLAMADLIAAYRVAHPGGSSTLAWHEGQARASAGEGEQAIALFEAARHPSDKNKGGWNFYVDASIAFLQHDRAALQAARDKLANLPYEPGEGMPPALSKDGYLEFPAEGDQPAMRVRWPPNIAIVEAFLVCFDKSYDEAYGSPDCRPRK